MTGCPSVAWGLCCLKRQGFSITKKTRESDRWKFLQLSAKTLFQVRPVSVECLVTEMYWRLSATVVLGRRQTKPACMLTDHYSTSVYKLITRIRNRNSVVGVATRLWALRFGVRIPVGAGYFFSSPNPPDL